MVDTNDVAQLSKLEAPTRETIQLTPGSAQTERKELGPVSD
jgi:hypothetical protein